MTDHFREVTKMIQPVRCGCGGEAEVLQPSGYREHFLVWCPDCGIKTSYQLTEAEAIETWNRAMGARDINVPNKDLISRQDAIAILSERAENLRDTYGDLGGACSGAVKLIESIPAAEPEPEEFEWCHDCKEYDQEKHCCHRWTKVIRQTVEEVKNHGKWIPVTEALPKDGEFVLLTIRRLEKKYNQNPFISVGYISWNQSAWWCAHDGDCDTHNVNVLAWMPLPETYRGEE